MKLNLALLISGLAAVAAAVILSPAESVLGPSIKLLYIHIPFAWLGALSFFLAGISSALYLKSQRFEWLTRSHVFALLGMPLIILATVTGSIWAKLSWGSYWNWDPREISIVILLMIYIAYFSLRSAFEGSRRKDSFSAIYLLFAMITVPFLVFIMPRLSETLHPSPIIKSGGVAIDATIRLFIFISIAGGTLFYLGLYRLVRRFYETK